MAGNIIWDINTLVAGLNRLDDALKLAGKNGLYKIGTEVLRLSALEVPHDKGMLQSSASTEPLSDTDLIVGYNKDYAAYQHEGHRFDGSHVIKHYGKGRKGKYLEDPIKNNLNVFNRFMQEEINNTLR